MTGWERKAGLRSLAGGVLLKSAVPAQIRRHSGEFSPRDRLPTGRREGHEDGEPGIKAESGGRETDDSSSFVQISRQMNSWKWVTKMNMRVGKKCSVSADTVRFFIHLNTFSSSCALLFFSLPNSITDLYLVVCVS